MLCPLCLSWQVCCIICLWAKADSTASSSTLHTTWHLSVMQHQPTLSKLIKLACDIWEYLSTEYFPILLLLCFCRLQIQLRRFAYEPHLKHLWSLHEMLASFMMRSAAQIGTFRESRWDLQAWAFELSPWLSSLALSWDMPFQVASFARRHDLRHSLPLPGGRIVRAQK